MQQDDDLASKKCVPCKGDVEPLRGDALAMLHARLPAGWLVKHEHHLTKEFPFKDFMTGLAFVNRIAEVAEREGHHPDIFLAWGRVRLEIWTHTIKGLTESDFVMAAKVDKLY